MSLDKLTKLVLADNTWAQCKFCHQARPKRSHVKGRIWLGKTGKDVDAIEESGYCSSCDKFADKAHSEVR